MEPADEWVPHLMTADEARGFPLLDPSKPYYHNARTGQSVWEDPHRAALTQQNAALQRQNEALLARIHELEAHR
eukprot:COSAG06_NODE_5605_length_3366_cov_10.977349_1_plen_74_part_00